MLRNGNIVLFLTDGYQVCGKWQKDRKGIRQSTTDMKIYCLICNAIQKTIDIQKKINDFYPEVEKEAIRF
jgi:hypothetical protein